MCCTHSVNLYTYRKNITCTYNNYLTPIVCVSVFRLSDILLAFNINYSLKSDYDTSKCCIHFNEDYLLLCWCIVWFEVSYRNVSLINKTTSNV